MSREEVINFAGYIEDVTNVNLSQLVQIRCVPLGTLNQEFGERQFERGITGKSIFSCLFIISSQAQKTLCFQHTDIRQKYRKEHLSETIENLHTIPT